MARVRELAQTRPSRPVDREDAGSQIDNVATPERAPNEKAVRAYRAMLPKEIDRGPLYHAGQIMRRQVVCVGFNDTLAKALGVLRSHNIHQAPVLDDAAQLVGMVGENALMAGIHIDSGKASAGPGRRVGDVMTTPVITAEPVTDIRRIATAMLTHRIDGVPVTGDLGRLVGYVSRSDILRAVVADPPVSLWR